MRCSWIRGVLAAGLVTAVLAVTTMGLVSAQETPTPTPTDEREMRRQEREEYRQRYLEALAARLGVTTEELERAMQEAREEVPKPAGVDERDDMHRAMHARLIEHELQVAADAIGISVDQLRQELPGSSLAEVAQAHGVDPMVVSDALKADAHARIDQIIDQYMTHRFPERGMDTPDDGEG